MADPSMYEEMGKDMGDGEDDAPPSSRPGASDEAIHDPEFEMHAKAAGFDTPAKMDAFWMAVQRCVELGEQAEPDHGEDTDEEDEEA